MDKINAGVCVDFGRFPGFIRCLLSSIFPPTAPPPPPPPPPLVGSRRVTAAERAEVDAVFWTVTASRRVARARASASSPRSPGEAEPAGRRRPHSEWTQEGKPASVCVVVAFPLVGGNGSSGMLGRLFEFVGYCSNMK